MTSDLPDPTANPPLIFGFRFEADGTAHPVTWATISAGALPTDGTRLWLHLNRLHPEVRDWLEGHSGIDPIIANALLQEDTRPRAARHLDGLLFNLRAINFNEGADPEDMIALRGWATANLVLTLRAFHIRAVQDVKDDILSGQTPINTGALLSNLAERITDRIEPVVGGLEDQADDLEETLLEGETHLIKTTIGELRRSVLKLRRYIIPQREAIAQAIREGQDLFAADQMLLLRETSDRVIRIAEELDAVRERLIVLQEQMVEERGERMNQRLYVLAILSAIFLPLGFVTGLFGVNVGGMPGVESGGAFALLCLGMALGAGGLVGVLKLMRWL